MSTDAQDVKPAQGPKAEQEYQSWAARVNGWITSLFDEKKLDEKYDEFQSAKDALAWYRKEFQPQDDVDYSHAVEYAHKLLERLDNTDKALDEKADSIIKYLGGGTSLVAVGAIFSVKTDTWVGCLFGLFVMACLLPALYFSYWAVRYAIKCRRPQFSSLVPDVKYAVEISNFNVKKEKIEPCLWLVLHPICEANLYRNLQKASCVESAHEYYLTSLKWLGIAIVAIAVSLIPATVVQFVKTPPAQSQAVSPVQVQIFNEGKKN